ncbi:MAG: PilN family type IVB pilus formation outer membrane protein [Candidatus Eutrophobiaceae bacterium]
MKRFHILFVCAMLSACEHLELEKRVSEAHNDTHKRIESKKLVSPGKRPQLTRVPRNWIGTTAVQLRKPLAPVLAQAITLSTAKPQTLKEIAQRIAWETQIPVRLGAEFSTIQIGGASPTPQALQKTVPSIIYRHSGSLISLLDKIAARLGIVWHFENNEILFTRFATRTFIIHALPGEARFNASVGGQAGVQDVSLGQIGTGSESIQLEENKSRSNVDSARQNTELDSRINRWEELIASINTLLSPGGKMNASSATGTILVTDTPEVLARMAEFIAHQNQQMTRQIAINIHVFSINDSEESEAGLQWDAVFDNSYFRTRLLSPLHSTGVGNLSLGLVSAAEDNKPKSDFAGSNAVIKALSGLTNVSTVTSANLVTLNNQPAPVQVTRSTGYLRSVSNVVAGANGVSETTLEPGKITTGFVITVTPRALDQDRILIRFAADLSTLLRLQTQETGNSTIQTPETDERSFLQEVIMRSGQTLVLSGFEQALSDQRDRGLGKARNWLAGNQKLRHAKTRILIVISPILIGERHGSA